MLAILPEEGLISEPDGRGPCAGNLMVQESRAGVAQLVEHRAENAGVRSSILRPGTIKLRRFDTTFNATYLYSWGCVCLSDKPQ